MTDPSAERSDDEALRPPRVFYRDMEEFHAALDKAAEEIRKRRRGPTSVVVDNLWWVLVTGLGFLHLADFAFDWKIRKSLLPGIDATQPLWIILGVWIAAHIMWSRGQRRRLIERRSCFTCGHGLRNVAVDDDGNGVCPSCARPFNVGEYHAPTDNVGRHFRGYKDDKHFTRAMEVAAERIKASEVTGFEGTLLGWSWMALGIVTAVTYLFDWSAFGWLDSLRSTGIHGLWFLVMLAWSGWYAWRIKRRRRDIAPLRRCFDCGFILLGTPVDDASIGRCPECGLVFHAGQYAAPGESSPDGGAP